MTIWILFILSAVGLVSSTVNPQQGLSEEAIALVKENLISCANKRSTFSFYLWFYLTGYQLGARSSCRGFDRVVVACCIGLQRIRPPTSSAFTSSLECIGCYIDCEWVRPASIFLYLQRFLITMFSELYGQNPQVLCPWLLVRDLPQTLQVGILFQTELQWPICSNNLSIKVLE